MAECAVDPRFGVIEGKSTYAAYAVTKHKTELPSTVKAQNRLDIELTGLACTINRYGYLAAVKILCRSCKILGRGDVLCTDTGDDIALFDACVLCRRSPALFGFNALHTRDHHAVCQHFDA